DRSYEMTAPGQAKPTTYAAAASAAEARALADEMIGVMSELLTVIEQETELSRHYVTTVGRLKASQPFMKQTTPELLGTLHRHHDTFRAMLQVNLTVLATAHAISEKIVRGVNAEIQRRNVPNTYTAGGRRAAPGARHLTPLAVSRTL
ncbi:MAG: hypothetical protein E6279_10825, partial [Streptococcus sp.]|nr:hypothetical protein [Streptococcus sp.]